jgi:hypothetical protein
MSQETPSAVTVPPARRGIERCARPCGSRGPSKGGGEYRARDLQWKGDALHLYGKGPVVVRIVPDQTYPGVWRVELPDGRLTDMVNRTRAKDAALGIACGVLSERQEGARAS